ncbi:replication factor A protein, partial [Trifolium medium]|nr:replication factor A protein [Trifolium medium]
NVSLQNVMNTTRVLVNPDVAEAVGFKDGFVLNALDANAGVAVLGPRVRPSLEEDFLRAYPKK